MALLLAFALGFVAGLRALTPLAAVSWAAWLGWIDLHATPFAFVGTTVALWILTLLAGGELVNDKLPFTPSRLSAGPLVARLVLGGWCGAIVALVGDQSWIIGAVLGAAGGLVGARVGYYLRVSVAPGFGLAPIVAALVEDAIAIGSALLLVFSASRPPTVLATPQTHRAYLVPSGVPPVPGTVKDVKN
jgi:uncharacterized membrane protein